MRINNIKKSSKKKMVAIVAAGTIAFSSLGGGAAYAANDGIQSAVNGMVATALAKIMPDLEARLDEAKNESIAAVQKKVEQMGGEINASVNSVYDRVASDGEARIRSYGDQKIAELEEAKQKEIAKAEKEAQQVEDAKYKEAKGAIDAAVSNALAK